jgi:hypothetical protein
MPISSATSAPPPPPAVAPAAPKPEAKEVHQAGRDTSNDGDSDDSSVKAAAKPVVNTSGQVTGTTVNTKA